jgi:hypothetical protein
VEGSCEHGMNLRAQLHAVSCLNLVLRCCQFSASVLPQRFHTRTGQSQGPETESDKSAPACHSSRLTCMSCGHISPLKHCGNYMYHPFEHAAAFHSADKLLLSRNEL